MLSRKPPIPEDLHGIDAALRQSRPELPEDRARFIAARARSRARASAGHHTSQKESFLRSRIAILSMLVLGFGFSTAGVGMAVTGVSEDQSAAGAQYQPAAPAPAAGQPPVPGETLAPPAESPAPAVEDEVEVFGETDEGDEAPATEDRVAPATEDRVAPVADENPVEETRQLAAEAGGDELPFTGFAAIPVLLLGLGLLTSGFVLRRSGAEK